MSNTQGGGMTDAELIKAMRCDEWRSKKIVMTRDDLVQYLSQGMSSQEIADWTGVSYEIVLRAIRTQVGKAEAFKLRRGAVQARIIAEYRRTKAPYNQIALNLGIQYRIVQETLQAYMRKKLNAEAFAPAVKPTIKVQNLQPGDFTFSGRRVTVLERGKDFTTAWVDGQWQVFNSSEVKEVG